MKTFKQNSEKERDKCWLLSKISFMKSLVAQFTLEPLIILFAYSAKSLAPLITQLSGLTCQKKCF